MPPTITDVATFRAKFPEFAAVSDAKIDIELEEAELSLAASVFGTSHIRAILFLAAHYTMLSVDLGGNAVMAQGSSPLVQATADGVSSTYATPATDKLWSGDLALSSTSYGQRFLVIRAQHVAGIRVAS